MKLGDGINCPPLLLGITLNGKSSQEDFKLIVDEVVALYQDAIRAIGANHKYKLLMCNNL